MTDRGPHTGPFGRQDPSLPQVFGRYLLVQRLSRGGMGEIFLAKHGLAGFEKLAVIKKVLPHLAADAQFISRFVDEAQVAIKLQHVNVAQVFEVGRVGDEYFLALEYVEGRDLRRTLALLGHRAQRLPVDLALFIGRELANGLAYAHRRTSADGASLNLVHCDISPPNVLVSFEGETKVIDFGIAKSAIRGTATDPKMGFGKFGYMAPEQLIRGGVVDHRTDIYAAGVVLYELLTGQRLYEAGPEPDYRALARKVTKGEHRLPSEVDPVLRRYDDLVAIALRPQAADRYQTAAEFRDAIQHSLVAVNPTISTDQLGAYMRELFAEEMTAQRELHERVASTHLADFQEHFHTQTISTVSFALAQLPLAEVPAGAAPRGKLAAPRPSPALDTMAPPTGALEQPIEPSLDRPAPRPAPSIEEPSLADGTGTAVRFVPPPRLRRLYAIAGGAILVVGVGLAALALHRRAGEPVQAPAVAGKRPEITVVPIDPPGPRPEVAVVAPVPAEIEMRPEPDAPAHRQRPPRDRRDRIEKSDRPEKKPEGLSREQVSARFQAVSRAYASYKTSHGERLSSEWADLTNFITFKMNADNLDAAMRKIDAFTAKMRE
ncbi:MAG: serine/threonine protein kinase [Kofleriaceae bacterium]